MYILDIYEEPAMSAQELVIKIIIRLLLFFVRFKKIGYISRKNAESVKKWGQLSQEQKDKYREEATSSAVRFKEQSMKPQVEVSRIMRYLQEIVSINYRLIAWHSYFCGRMSHVIRVSIPTWCKALS